MKAFKRLAALAAALALCAGAAGAVYTDGEAIGQKEAVEAVTQLGVFSGYDDGSFRPEAELSRQETAKMFAVILTGGDIRPEDYLSGGSFTDVSGLWSAGYINYLADKGLLAGDGAGKFDPLGGITSRQMAKLLLICLGHEAGEFTPENWAAVTDAAAEAAGLYNGVSSGREAALSRQDAARMIYNALEAESLSGKTFRELYFPEQKPDTQPVQGKNGYALIDYTTKSTAYDQDAGEFSYEYDIIYADGSTARIKTPAEKTGYGAYMLKDGLMENRSLEGTVIQVYGSTLALDTNGDGSADTYINISGAAPVEVADGASLAAGAKVVCALDDAGAAAGLWLIG